MSSLPWYRQFWPWFLFGLPASVVVAGLTTWWIAAHNADALVADDYYKEGLAINRQLGRQQLAETLGLHARLSYREGHLEVFLTGKAQPAALRIMLSHPLDAARDLELRLARIQPGVYRAPAALAGTARWDWRLEPLVANAPEHWQLAGELRLDQGPAKSRR